MAVVFVFLYFFHSFVPSSTPKQKMNLENWCLNQPIIQSIKCRKQCRTQIKVTQIQQHKTYKRRNVLKVWNIYDDISFSKLMSKHQKKKMHMNYQTAYLGYGYLNIKVYLIIQIAFWKLKCWSNNLTKKTSVTST